MSPRTALPGLLACIALLALLASAAGSPITARSPRLASGLPPGIGTLRGSYDLQLGYLGYTGLAESGDCRAMVDPLGYDSLLGTLSGVENPAGSDDPVVYTGTLRRVTRIDYCLAIPAPTADQPNWCKARLTGAARMTVELTVSGNDGDGAWLKSQPANLRPDSVRVIGNCLQADMDSIKADYPSGESAGTPDGQPIAEPDTVKFAVQGVRRLRVGYFPPDPPETVWGLRVLRAVP